MNKIEIIYLKHDCFFTKIIHFVDGSNSHWPEAWFSTFNVESMTGIDHLDQMMAYYPTERVSQVVQENWHPHIIPYSSEYQ